MSSNALLAVVHVPTSRPSSIDKQLYISYMDVLSKVKKWQEIDLKINLTETVILFFVSRVSLDTKKMMK